MMDTVSLSNTWSETIKAVEHEKRHLPWDKNQVEPVKRVSLYERKRQEREFDPVTMQYRDEGKEEKVRSMKLEQQMTKMRTTLDRMSQNFNIVSHEGPPRQKEDIIKNPRNNKTRDFNFMTNMRHEDHAVAPTLYDEAFNIEKIKARSNANRAQTAHVKVRDFNMINNEFYENKTARVQEEESALRETLTKKFWDNRDYDPVKARYYDENKEELYQQQRQMLSAVRGSSKSLKLPPSVQYSDGNSYNILTHNVYDDQRLKATRVMEDRSLNRIKRLAIENDIRQRGHAMYDTAEARKLNRVSYKRWEGQVERGFDMMTNSITTLDSPGPLPSRPPSMWNRLNTAPQLSANRYQQHHHSSNGTSREDDLAAMRNELVPSTRGRNLSGSGIAALPGTGGLRLPSGGGNNKEVSRAPTAPNMQQYESFLSAATELPHLSSNNSYVDSGRSATQNGFNNVNNNNSNNDINSALGSARDSSARHSARAATALPGTRPGLVPSRISTGTAKATKAIPSLDLTRTDFAEPVRYTEPQSGPKGLSVPMVRTGGLSSYRGADSPVSGGY